MPHEGSPRPRTHSGIALPKAADALIALLDRPKIVKLVKAKFEDWVKHADPRQIVELSMMLVQLREAVALATGSSESERPPVFLHGKLAPTEWVEKYGHLKSLPPGAPGGPPMEAEAKDLEDPPNA